MSLPTQVEEMREQLNAHRAWFDNSRTGRELDIAPDPSQPNAADAASAALLAAVGAGQQPAFLRGVRLSGLRLAGASLAGALLSSAVLIDVDLSDARLDGADLTGADLTRVRLNRASAVRADLADQWYDCEANDAQFTGAHLAKSEIFRTALRCAMFDDAVMLGVEFFDCDLRGARFRNADLTRARFQSCDLRGADLTGANVQDARLFESLLDGVRGEPLHAQSVRAQVYGQTQFSSRSEIRPVPGVAGAVEVTGERFVAGLRGGLWR